MIKAYQATGAEVTEQAKAWIYSWRSPLRRTLIRPTPCSKQRRGRRQWSIQVAMVYIMTFAPSRSTRRRRDRPQYGVARRRPRARVRDRRPANHGHLIEVPPRRERLRCETAQKES